MKAVGYAVLVVLLVAFSYYIGGIAYKADNYRSFFPASDQLAGSHVFCEVGADQLALETYCRLIQAGARPAPSPEKADLLIYYFKGVLYISDRQKDKIFLNLPTGEVYLADTQANYIKYLDAAIAEYVNLHQ